MAMCIFPWILDQVEPHSQLWQTSAMFQSMTLKIYLHGIIVSLICVLTNVKMQKRQVYSFNIKCVLLLRKCQRTLVPLPPPSPHQSSSYSVLFVVQFTCRACVPLPTRITCAGVRAVAGPIVTSTLTNCCVCTYMLCMHVCVYECVMYNKIHSDRRHGQSNRKHGQSNVRYTEQLNQNYAAIRWVQKGSCI